MISGTQLFLICLFLTLLAFAFTESYAQNSATFLLTASLPREILHRGEVLEIRVLLSNPTSRVLYAGAGSNGGLALELINPAGENIGLRIMGGPRKKGDCAPFPPTSRRSRIKIPANEKLEVTWRLIPEEGSLIAGDYRLRLSIRDLRSGADVYSPYVQLTVPA